MKQEDKELLLKELSGRLPYGLIVNIPNVSHSEVKAYIKAINPEREIIYYEIGGSSPLFDRNISGIKPYLRSKSSMTIEEIKHYHDLCAWNDVEYYEFGEWTTKIVYNDTWESIDYLNSIHVDYRDLIPMGLALEAPKDMYRI